MNYIRRLYCRYSNVHGGKAYFKIEDGVKICQLIMEHQKQTKTKRMIQISDKIAKTCWGLSKMTVKNIEKDHKRTKHMVFVEFLEFICRLAYAAPIYINYELDSNASDNEGLLSPNFKKRSAGLGGGNVASPIGSNSETESIRNDENESDKGADLGLTSRDDFKFLFSSKPKEAESLFLRKLK